MEKLDFMKKFRPEDLCIKEFDNWIVCIRRKQTTLGDAVILLKRETPDIGDINKEEAAEFSKVIKWYENLCKEKFGAEKFNYIAMMMHDPFVHYHAFPRYNNTVNYLEIKWEDNNVLENFSSSQAPDEEILFRIKDYMKEEQLPKNDII